MIFVKLDVTLRDHEKLLTAIDDAGWGVLGVYSWALMYLRGSESATGILSHAVVKLSMPTQKDTGKLIAALVKAKLFEARDEGFYVCNYEKKNEIKPQIDARRAETLARVTRYRKDPKRECNNSVPGSGSGSLSSSDSSISSPVPDPPVRLVPPPPPSEPPEVEPSRKPDVRLAEYAVAYEKGITEATGSEFGLASGWQLDGDMQKAVKKHAYGSKSGKPLRGPDTLAWIEAQAYNFAACQLERIEREPAKSHFFTFKPKQFLNYLNEQRDVTAQKAAP